jgi:multidrug efflux pump
MLVADITLLMLQLQSISHRAAGAADRAAWPDRREQSRCWCFGCRSVSWPMLGTIALFGMIMRNSVILVDQIEQDEKAGKCDLGMPSSVPPCAASGRSC